MLVVVVVVVVVVFQHLASFTLKTAYDLQTSPQERLKQTKVQCLVQILNNMVLCNSTLVYQSEC